jgi:formylglycine-generating enzyme required for sulfatase activity/predicted Ser/Thr protein kinase
MICCLNPDCDHPLNSDNQKYCQNCGTTLVPLLRNRYKITKPLGRGGFGKTYLAEDTDKLNEPCVVKQLAYQAQGTWAAKKVSQLFEQEAKQLQRLTGHSQIPTLLAYFEETGSLYLVQEFIDGQDLSKELKQAAFTETQVRELLLDIVPILKFIHEKGIIHRDIKPENIMRRKEDGKPVLIDFGVAKLLGPSMMTNTGTTLGSQGYAPLEQITQGKANPGTDLFSLGASCFHLLSQKHPFELWAYQGFGWVSNWREEVSTPISQKLGEIIDKLLKSNPEERYQSATEVLEDLQQQYIVNPQPSQTPVPSTSSIPPSTLKPTPPPKAPQPVSPTIPVPPPTPIPTPQPRVSQPPRVPTPQPQTIPTPPQYVPTPPSNVDSPNRRKLLTYLGLGGLGFAGVVVWASTRQNGAKLSTEIVTVDNSGNIINRRPLPRIKTLTEDLGNGITLEMVEIPGGRFNMGSPASEAGRESDESPQHQVSISLFSMGKFTVTQAQWQAVASLSKVKTDLKPDPSNFKGKNRPVETVSWYDAVEFCARLSQKIGKTYRLPSEAEWEYACRAGTTTPFHFGATLTTDLANYDGNVTYGSAPEGKYRQATTDVGTFPPNAFGLYDMHGNVWEWCADVWHENYNGAPVNGSVWNAGGDNSRRILRGGSWYYNPGGCRSAIRLRLIPDDVGSNLGFRVVLSSPGG